MNSESRKASRDSFATQRARLLFYSRPPLIGLDVAKGRNHETPSLARARRDIVRDGLIGFVPKGVH
jgi:hypothetical protein